MTDAVAAIETPVVATPAAVVAPVVVAPVAPVALAVDAPVAAVVPPVVTPPVALVDGEAITYDPTGDPGLDVALSFVGQLGLKADHPGMVAAGRGDFGLLKAHLATLGDKARGWEQMVALAEDSYTRTSAANEVKATAVQTAVHAVAGGAENWATIQTWANATADPAEKAELNAMFDAGPLQARAAAKLIVDAHAAAKGTVVTPRNATVAAPGAQAAAATNGPLSTREYGAAVRDLHAKQGNRMAASPEYAALRARLRV